MEIDKDELEDVLAEMDARTHPTRILKTRTTDLYKSISGSIRNPRQSTGQIDIFRPTARPDDQKNDDEDGANDD
jgi:hypothetical protein